MLALAGLPGTAGFIGKLFLIQAAVDADYTWLGVAIVVGTMISLAYYLRVVAAVWMRPGTQPEPEGADVPAIAGGSPEVDAEPAEVSPSSVRRTDPGIRCRVIIALTVLAAAATVFFGVIPAPLVDWAENAGQAIAPFLEQG
jgi:NADH-quinone oxidoreductase subunit N